MPGPVGKKLYDTSSLQIAVLYFLLAPHRRNAEKAANYVPPRQPDPLDQDDGILPYPVSTMQILHARWSVGEV
jgi:hypothetical protein